MTDATEGAVQWVGRAAVQGPPEDQGCVESYCQRGAIRGTAKGGDDLCLTRAGPRRESQCVNTRDCWVTHGPADFAGYGLALLIHDGRRVLNGPSWQDGRIPRHDGDGIATEGHDDRYRAREGAQDEVEWR